MPSCSPISCIGAIAFIALSSRVCRRVEALRRDVVRHAVLAARHRVNGEAGLREAQAVHVAGLVLEVDQYIAGERQQIGRQAAPAEAPPASTTRRKAAGAG